MKPNFEEINQLNPEATLTPNEVSKLVGMTPAGVLAAIRRGKFSAIKIGGRYFMTGARVTNIIIQQTEIAGEK